MSDKENENHKISWYDDGGALLDQIICSCGWESDTFFDGQEYAYNQWKKHVKKRIKEDV